MAKKKKKLNQLPKLTLSELVEQAASHLESGRLAEALSLLAKAQNEIHRQRSLGGKIAPADSAATLARINQLQARAYFRRGMADKSLSKKTNDLQEAVKRAPAADYLVALGACHLLQDETEAAQAHFQQAQLLSPDSLLSGSASLLGALATGRSREAKELLKLWTPQQDDPRLTRLSVLRHLLAGNLAPARARVESSPSDSLLSAGPLLRGVLELAAGDNEAASQQLDTPLALWGKQPRAEAAVMATQQFYNSVAHFQAARFKEAALGFQDAARLLALHEIHELPWRGRLAAYYHRIAANVLNEGNLTTALTCWQQAVQLNANDKVAKANLLAARETKATKEWQNGNVAVALELWQEVLKTKQQDENLLRNVALAWERLERPAEAIPFWRQVARLLRVAARGKTATESEKQRLARLEKHLLKLMADADRPGPEIIKELEDALRADVNNRELRRDYAMFLLEMGRLPQALKQYESIERAEGETVDILVHKGMALDLMGKPATARRCLERALALEPDNKLARNGLVVMLSHEVNLALQAQDTGRVIELCQQQLALVPESMPALQTLASIYLMTGRAREAEEMIARIIAFRPQDPVIHTMAGRIYLIGEAHKKAEKEFRRALDIDPGPDILFRIGSIYLSVRDSKKALKYFHQATPKASCELLIAMGNELVADEQEREAERYFDLAAAKDPAHPEPHLAKGAMFMNTGRFEKGRQEIDIAGRLAQGRPEFAGLREEIAAFKRDLINMAKLQSLLGENDLPPGMPQELRRLLAGLEKGSRGFF